MKMNLTYKQAWIWPLVLFFAVLLISFHEHITFILQAPSRLFALQEVMARKSLMGSVKWFFVHSSYYFITLLFIAWIYRLFTVLKKLPVDYKSLTKKYIGYITALAVLSFLVWQSVPEGHKVLSDETNLLSTSRSLLYDHQAKNVTQGKYYYDNFQTVHYEVPKRPLLFPYLVQILHVFLGYSPQNAFTFNGIVLWLLLCLVFIMVTHALGRLAGICAVFFVLANPIISICAQSGGYDLLSVFMFFLCVALFVLYLTYKQAHIFEALWISLIVFAQVRYENIVYLLVFTGALAWFKRLDYRHFHHKAYIFSLTPFILSLIHI